MTAPTVTHQNPEPTLHDVMGVLVGMDKKIDNIENRLDRVENRLDGVENSLTVLEDRVGTLERTVGSMQVTMLEMQEDISAGLKAIDNNSVQLIDHDKRIRRVEKVALA